MATSHDDYAYVFLLRHLIKTQNIAFWELTYLNKNTFWCLRYFPQIKIDYFSK